MIISESKWRKWLGLPYISVQPEWVEELCDRFDIPTAVANGTRWAEYRWSEEVHDWLFQSGGRWSLEHCRSTGDFMTGDQARIWFRSMKNVTLFKLTFGGKDRPKDMPLTFGVTKQAICASVRKLNATWTINPPTAFY